MEARKVYYSIREVEHITSLPSSTLRYWETQFEDLRPRKDDHGNRFYTEADIALIQRIKFMRDDMHVTRIEAIRNALKADEKEIDARQRATDILLRLRQQLVDLRASI
ncbi:MAG: MerR family transcriptional regulator [Paludibacteraceae bacterium]|nr:MerR family transcriptional regulator [Paludibacteraceae bacterium]